jgi:hypothetical protein
LNNVLLRRSTMQRMAEITRSAMAVCMG